MLSINSLVDAVNLRESAAQFVLLGTLAVILNC